jgi:putative CocE/NonD family hydrolase
VHVLGSFLAVPRTLLQWVGQGYVYAVQDKRGKFESEGEYTISGGDAEGGYDTVDWLAEQPWSNGRIGTIGCSYNGDVQMFLAAQRNPHHAAMVPQATGSSNGSAGGRHRQFGSRCGGNIGLASAFGWSRRNGLKVSYRPLPGHFPDFYKTKELILI